MTEAVKTWVFASDAEGLADAGNNGDLAFAYEGSDGNPSGSVKFTITAQNAGSPVEYARNPSTGETWEDWGVTPGATVTAVQITDLDERLASNNKLASHNVKIRIIGSGGSTVHSAGDLLDLALGTSVDGSWQDESAGTQRAVDAGSQASTTDVRLEIEYTATMYTGAGADLDQRFDNIELTITYTTGGTLYYQAAAGVVGPSGSVVKRPGKVLAGQVGSVAGSLVKRAGKVLAGVVGPSGSVVKRAGKSLAGAVGSVAGSLDAARVVLVSLSGQVGSVAGSLVKRPGKVLAGVVGPSGSVVKRIGKSLAGAVSWIGSVIGSLVAGGDTRGAVSVSVSDLGAVAGELSDLGAVAGELADLGAVVGVIDTV